MKPFLISIATVFFVETATTVVISTDIMSPMFAQGMARMVEIGSFILIFIMWGEGLSSLGLARNQILPGLKRGLIWSAGFGCLVCIAGAILCLFGRNPLKMLHASLPEQHWELFFFLLLRCVIGPVAEEILFRGILYGFLRRGGIFIALFLSSLIFFLAHRQAAGLPQMVGGILFAVAYELEGKLMTPITIHVLGNMAIFVVFGLLN